MYLPQVETNILVIDPSIAWLGLITNILNDAGYGVYPCKSMAQAHNVLAQESVDTVVCDVSVDVPGDGLRLAHELLNGGKHCILLAYSGSVSGKDLIVIGKACINKPDFPAQFLAVISQNH